MQHKKPPLVRCQRGLLFLFKHTVPLGNDQRTGSGLRGAGFCVLAVSNLFHTAFASFSTTIASSSSSTAFRYPFTFSLNAFHCGKRYRGHGFPFRSLCVPAGVQPVWVQQNRRRHRAAPLFMERQHPSLSQNAADSFLWVHQVAFTSWRRGKAFSGEWRNKTCRRGEAKLPIRRQGDISPKLYCLLRTRGGF